MGEIIEKLQSYNLNEETYEKVLKTIQDKVNGIEDIDWQEIIDKYDIKIDGKPIHRDTLRKSSQTIFGAGFVSEYLEQKYSKENSSLSEDEYFKELEVKKRELEKEKQKLQDQKREYRNLIRIDARFEHLAETIKEEISKIDKEPYLNDYIDDGSEKYTCASLLLSDWHCGLEIYDTLNTFNFEVLKERVLELRDRVIMYCKKQNVYELNIELLVINV